MVIAVITFYYFNTSKATRVDFGNIRSYHDKRVSIEGFLGENISLQQYLLHGGFPDDSGYQYYFLYSSEKSSNEKIILVLDDSNYPYIDQGAFIRVTGKVEVSDSVTIYLHVTSIN